MGKIKDKARSEKMKQIWAERKAKKEPTEPDLNLRKRIYANWLRKKNRKFWEN